MLGNLRLDHVTLALADGRHVDRDGIADRPELRRVADQARDLRAPDQRIKSLWMRHAFLRGRLGSDPDGARRHFSAGA